MKIGLIAAVASLTLLSACGGSGGPGSTASATPAVSGSGALSGAPPSLSPSPPALAAALTCAQLRNAAVTTASVKLPDYPFDSINLADGIWSAEDGTQIEMVDACGIGDFVGDGAADAVGAVKISMGGTGRFYTLVAWRNLGGAPDLVATLALGDRNPPISITIAGKQITVVYLTRTDGAPMAALDLKRTAVYKIVGTTFVEVSHSDQPYSG